MSGIKVRFGAEDLGRAGGPLPRGTALAIVDWSRVKGGCDGQPDQARIVDRGAAAALAPDPVVDRDRGDRTPAVVRLRRAKNNRGRWGCVIGLLTLVIRGSFWQYARRWNGDEVKMGRLFTARDRRFAVRCSADAPADAQHQGSTITLSARKRASSQRRRRRPKATIQSRTSALSSTWPIARSTITDYVMPLTASPPPSSASMARRRPWSLE